MLAFLGLEIGAVAHCEYGRTNERNELWQKGSRTVSNGFEPLIDTFKLKIKINCLVKSSARLLKGTHNAIMVKP